jgi:hypothetical protein
MAYNDNVRISIYGPVTPVEQLYKSLAARTTVERTERDDGWRVTFDGMLRASVDDGDIPEFLGDPRAVARERLIRFLDPREKDHEFGPACVLVSGDLVADGERMTNWFRTLCNQYPVSVLVHLTLEYLQHSATLFHGSAESTLYEVGRNHKTGTEEFSAMTGCGYQTLVSETFPVAVEELTS